MDRLGYTGYVGQGGAFGAAVTDALGRQERSAPTVVEVLLANVAAAVEDYRRCAG